MNILCKESRLFLYGEDPESLCEEQFENYLKAPNFLNLVLILRQTQFCFRSSIKRTFQGK